MDAENSFALDNCIGKKYVLCITHAPDWFLTGEVLQENKESTGKGHGMFSSDMYPRPV